MLLNQNTNLNKSLNSRLTTQQRITLSRQTIAKYASFDENSIGRIIARLIQGYEGKRYVYQTLYSDVKILKNKKVAKKYIKAILPEEEVSLVTTKPLKTKVALLAEPNQTLILSRGEVSLNQKAPSNNKISFYQFNKENGTLKLSTNFTGYPYVLEFINKLIIYKTDRGRLNLTESELEALMIEFLDEKIALLENTQSKSRKKVKHS